MELYEECLHMFVSDDCFQSLTTNLQAKDVQAAFQDAHTLKGVAGNLSLVRMYDRLREIVEILRKGSLDGTAELMDSISQERMQLEQLIQE
jgi:HPt (histidine-containing phosphotransfer) domain-containing protein